MYRFQGRLTENYIYRANVLRGETFIGGFHPIISEVLVGKWYSNIDGEIYM